MASIGSESQDMNQGRSLPGGVERGQILEIRSVKAPAASQQAVYLTLRMGADEPLGDGGRS